MDVSKSSSDVNKLVKEMGFSKAEATMALTDSRGDLNQAIEKLLAGEYEPPPYSENQEQQTVGNCYGGSALPQFASKESAEAHEGNSETIGNRLTNFLGDLTRRKVEVPKVKEDPTAPSFYDLTEQLHSLPSTAKQMPPPYEIEEKHKKVTSWEEEFSVFHVQLNTPSSSQMQMMGSSEDVRCDVCFSILKSSDADILSQNGKVR